MKKALAIAGITGALALGMVNARAITFTDFQTFDPPEALPTFGFFDLLSQGFDPSSQMITMATATFNIYNASQTLIGEAFILVDGDAFNSANPISISSGINSVGEQLVLGVAALNFGEGGVPAGMVSYTLALNDPNVPLSLVTAQLTAFAELKDPTPPPGVPDGGTTLGLLGLGLLGLGWVGRKRVQ